VGPELIEPYTNCHLHPPWAALPPGLTGGLAAPLVAAGAATIIGSAGAAALGSAAGIAVMTSLFGAAGAGLTGKAKSNRSLGEGLHPQWTDLKGRHPGSPQRGLLGKQRS
jgi:hypothetical protein